MTLDTSLSLDVVITILVIFGAVWRLDGKIAELRGKLEGDISDLRRELKSDIAESRQELKNDIQRLEKRIETVETKVDDSNQRLARLGGRFEDREDRFASQSEADSAA